MCRRGGEFSITAVAAAAAAVLLVSFSFFYSLHRRLNNNYTDK